MLSFTYGEDWIKYSGEDANHLFLAKFSCMTWLKLTISAGIILKQLWEKQRVLQVHLKSCDTNDKCSWVLMDGESVQLFTDINYLNKGAVQSNSHSYTTVINLNLMSL